MNETNTKGPRRILLATALATRRERMIALTVAAAAHFGVSSLLCRSCVFHSRNFQALFPAMKLRSSSLT